jgi:hypothetical protein
MNLFKMLAVLGLLMLSAGRALAVTTYDFSVFTTEYTILTTAAVAAVVALIPVTFGWFGIKNGALALLGFVKRVFSR